ncbi:MAG: M20/M25/M40 family metallo-hydrolase [Bacteroidaceae bacterium]|nr:M20/M25/M40 family metallo-hydrolase [Bacteroidaceae bacterium]
MNFQTASAFHLLQSLIACPSPSREEHATADLLHAALTQRGLTAVERLHNNIYIRSARWDADAPTLLLCSHHDTVRPAASYTRDPYSPAVEGDRLYGLGSNDAGASVVCLVEAFCALQHTPLAVNMILALVGEEEIGGAHGVSALLPELGPIDMALVGEPTGMQAAVGERGLVVLDGEAHGKSGHAARGEGINALYRAIDDINSLRTYRFPRTSSLLGDIGVSVTGIECGTQHNVVPDVCRYMVDVRTTDAYTNEETVGLLQSVVRHSTLTPRSTRLRASAISDTHPLVAAARATGATTFVSPTMSDMSLIPAPSLKMGPGQSARSHTADEYVLLSEIAAGIAGYTALIQRIRL